MKVKLKQVKDEFNKDWIIENALEEIKEYEKGILTLRGLHYRLVSRGMTNTQRHYKRVISALTFARWQGMVSFDTFSDNDRAMIGRTRFEETSVEDSVESTEYTIKYWLNNYYKNKWENQPNYVEVFIEKKALQGVFEGVCSEYDVALGACKGYPSLTFLNEASLRFKEAKEAGKIPIILYFGDYDPSGEDIPRSIKQNLWDMGIDVEVRRIALMEHQVLAWKLPPAPAKAGDSRTANWGGLGQVELDAVEPNKIKELCREALNGTIDEEKAEILTTIEAKEKKEYIALLKESIKNF